MILGIGLDLTDVKRVEQVYNRHGERFLNRIFTETERKKALSRSTPAPTLAKRFAAKEAFAKALGTGMAQGVAWRQIGIVNSKSGKPEFELKGEALAKLQAMTPKGMVPKVHVTLTDEGPLAQALVMITAESAST
jgi:holo-[acyl-carrier protein] synthase